VWVVISKTLKIGGAAVVLSILGATAALANHDAASASQELKIPGIWVDPDGCQHWVMDDGWEGFMTPNVMPDGRPVCGARQTCGIIGSDHLFATDQHTVTGAAKRALLEFFGKANATAFRIDGHTDNRASAAYNIALSQRRANAVAVLAKEAGFRVARVRGFGESQPQASNKTRAGMALNRRVEIECVK
jgi:outer membrane protein OmpA-like peptidoglycan-associated protein